MSHTSTGRYGGEGIAHTAMVWRSHAIYLKTNDPSEGSQTVWDVLFVGLGGTMLKDTPCDTKRFPPAPLPPLNYL